MLIFNRVSIHAPAWGATPADGDVYPHDAVSIHAPAWGATSTRASYALPESFNPRARVGRDSRAAGLLQPTKKVSIHAPAWGATWKQG